MKRLLNFSIPLTTFLVTFIVLIYTHTQVKIGGEVKREPSSGTLFYQAFSHVFLEPLEIPERCIVENLSQNFNPNQYAKIVWRGASVSQMHIMGFSYSVPEVQERGLYYPENQLSRGQAPRIIVLRRDCENILESAAIETENRYGTGENNQAFFSYTPGRPRLYCGSSPREEDLICDVPKPFDQQMVAKIHGNTAAPSEIQSYLESIRNPDQVWSFNEQQKNEFVVYAIEDESSNSPGVYFELRNLNATPARIRGTDYALEHNRYRVGLKARLKYIHYDPQTVSPLQRNRSTLSPLGLINRDFSSLLQRSEVNLQSSSGPIDWLRYIRNHNQRTRIRMVRRDLIRLKDYIVSKANSLKNYWARQYQFLGDPDISSPIFSINDNNNENEVLEALRSAHDARTLDLVDFVTELIMGQMSEILYAPQSREEVSEAAALWWVTRDLRTKFACNDDGRRPRAGLQDMIFREYNYQICRNEYATRGHYNLSTEYVNSQNVKLNGLAWSHLFKVSSRKERSALIARALPLIIRRAERGRTVDLEEISLLASHYIQTLKELELSVVYTWKGAFPMRGNDRSTLQQDKRLLEQFFSRYIAVTRQSRNQSWENFYHSFILAHKMSSHMVSVNWDYYTEDHDGVARDIIAHLNNVGSIDNQDILTLFQISIIDTDLLHNSHLCQTWLDFLNRATIQVGESVEKWNVYQRSTRASCIHTIPFWIVQMHEQGPEVRPQNSQQLCNEGHEVACFLQNARPGDLNSNHPSSPSQWRRYFNQFHRSYANGKNLIDEFWVQYEAIQASGNRREKRFWRELVQNISGTLRQQISDVSRSSPTIELLDQCLGRREWGEFIARTRPAMEYIELGSSCDVETPEIFKALLANLATILKASHQTNRANALENHSTRRLLTEYLNFYIQSPIRTYIYWIKKLKEHRLRYGRVSNDLLEEILQNAQLMFQDQTGESLRDRMLDLPENFNGSLILFYSYPRSYSNFRQTWTSFVRNFYSDIAHAVEKLKQCQRRRNARCDQEQAGARPLIGRGL